MFMFSQKQKNDEYTQQEKEYRFARWFWNQADTANWNATKLFLTFIITLFISLVAYFAINSIITAPLNSFILVGLLFTVLLLINGNIRERLNRFLAKRRNYESTEPITAYENLNLYFLENHDEIMFLENDRDITAIGLFKLKAIPLVIKGNFERFIRSLYQQQIPVFWLYVQAPVEQGAILYTPAVSEEARAFYEEQSPFELESRMEARNGMWKVRLIFGTRHTLPAGINIEAKRVMLYNKLKADLIKIQTAFVSAYPHTILELLQGKELEKAMSIAITGGGIPAFF